MNTAIERVSYTGSLKEGMERKREGGTPPGLHETVKEIMSRLPKGKLLDCLAFRGEQSKTMKQMGHDVVACDLYPELFQVDDIECVKANLDVEFPFEEASFDYILLNEAIEHLESPWHVIREAYRVLKPGGAAVFSTPNTLSLLSRFLFFSKGVFLYFSEFEFHKPAHINPLTLNEMKLIFEDTGFQIEEIHGTGHRAPKLALWGLKALSAVCSVMADLAFGILCAITGQNKPKTNSLLSPTIQNSQGILLLVRKKKS